MYENLLSELSRKLEVEVESVNDIDQKEIVNIDNDSLSSIIKQDYELLIAENSFQIARVEKKLAFKNRWLPEVSVSSAVDWGSLYKEDGANWEDSAVEPSLTISVNVPLYEKNENLVDLKQSELAIKSMRINLESIKISNKKLLNEYISDYNNKVELLSISALRVESTKRTYEMTEKSYKLGIKSRLEYFESENTYHEAQQDYIFDYYELLLMRLKIGRLLGNTLELL